MGPTYSEYPIFWQNGIKFCFCHPDRKMRDYLPKGGMWGWSSVYKVEVGMPWYGRNCILGEYCTWFIWIFGFWGLFCPLGLWLWCYIIPTMVIYCRSEGSEQLFIELGEGLDIEITIVNAVCVPVSPQVLSPYFLAFSLFCIFSSSPP